MKDMVLCPIIKAEGKTNTMQEDPQSLLPRFIFPTILLMALSMLLVFSWVSFVENLPAADAIPSIDKPPLQYPAAFRRGALALFADSNYFHDPHCFMALGLLRKRLMAEFGPDQVDFWVSRAISETCLIKTGDGWAGARVIMPFLPNPPYCIEKADIHANAQLLLALIWNGMYDIRRPSWNRRLIVTRDTLIEWLKWHTEIDDLSPGIELQALINADVSLTDTWQSVNGKHWSIKKLLEGIIIQWQENRAKAALKQGDNIPDNLLHLAPALIDLFQHFPDTLETYGPVLKEIFSFYADMQHADGYWGVPGEAFATGHIAEQCLRAKRAGLNFNLPFMRSIRLMVEHQSAEGWFGSPENRFTGLQSHGLRALGEVLEHPALFHGEGER